MIRTNLSTRPFYNERAVHVWALVIALGVAAATIFNVSRVIRYSRSDTQLALQASRDEARAADLHRQAVRLRGSVDPKQVEHASSEARLANDLIDRRTFSWTELFNWFEGTLPDDARIIAVRPKVDRTRGIVLSISVVARTTEDVAQFTERLQDTGAFLNPHVVEEHVDEQQQGLLISVLESGYVPAAVKPAGHGGEAARP